MTYSGTNVDYSHVDVMRCIGLISLISEVLLITLNGMGNLIKPSDIFLYISDVDYNLLLQIYLLHGHACPYSSNLV